MNRQTVVGKGSAEIKVYKGKSVFEGIAIGKIRLIKIKKRNIVCIHVKDVFKTQLRALYRASVYGNIAIMFPMITSVWEIRGGTKDSLLKDKIVLECVS